MKDFILGEKPGQVREKRLLAIVVAHIPYGYINPSISELAASVVKKYCGSVIKNKNQALVATFEGPIKALHFSMYLMGLFPKKKKPLAIGIHITEEIVDEKCTLSCACRNFIQTALNELPPGRISVTQVVKYLLAGSGLEFTPQEPAFKRVGVENLKLFTIDDSFDKRQFDLFQNELFKNKREPFFETVLQCINTHMHDETFNVKKLCKIIGMSERHLQRKLKRISNQSPCQLITLTRLYRAKQLLLTGNYNIAETAFLTGFSCPSYFSRRFKKEFRMNPSCFILKWVRLVKNY